MSIDPSLRHTLYRLAEKEMPPAEAKFLLNVWPPLFGTGIRITEIADGWPAGWLELRLSALTANVHGTAFGGTLFSITDMLFDTLVMQRLDVRKYEAWTRTGLFGFIRPGKNDAYLEAEMPDEMVEKFKAETEGGYSMVVPHTFVIRDHNGSLAGIGQQELYMRRRGRKKPPTNPNQQGRVAGENLIPTTRTLTRLGMRGVENRDVPVQQKRTAWRCISPESRAVTWLHGILKCDDVTVGNYRAVGFPDVVVEALISDNPSPAARRLLMDVVIAHKSPTKF